MQTKPLSKLKEAFEKKIGEKNQTISDLKDELKKAKQTKRGLVEKTVLFEFPDTFNIENFPAGFKILNPEDIKYPEHPKSITIENPTEEVRISNIDELSKILTDVFSKEKEVENKAEIKPAWIDGTIVSFLEGLGYLLGKITNRVFKVAPTPDSYLTPQYVMMIDPKTGKAMAPVTNVHVNAGGGGLGGPANVGIKNNDGETINPATNEKLDDVIAALGDISIEADNINLNTDELEASVKDSLDNYKVSDIDDANTTKYYGFLDKTGAWYILREDSTLKTYRYAKGTSGYETPTTGAWATRASQTYDYFHNIF